MKCDVAERLEQQGIKQGRLQTLVELVNEGLLDANIAAKKINITEKEFLALVK